MIFLVAANPQDARACARNHGLDPRTWRYLSSPDTIQGYYKQTAWLVDGYLNRTNAEQILFALDRRDFTVVNRSINKKGVQRHVRTFRQHDGGPDDESSERNRERSRRPGTGDLFL